MLSNLASSNGGLTWTATLTPTAGVNDATNLILLDASTVQDLAGNAGVGIAISSNYALDATRPTATIVVADWNSTSIPNSRADNARALSTTASIMNKAEPTVPPASHAELRASRR